MVPGRHSVTCNRCGHHSAHAETFAKGMPDKRCLTCIECQQEMQAAQRAKKPDEKA